MAAVGALEIKLMQTCARVVNNTELLPSRADIDVYGSCDERSACESFLGKSLDEAQAMFCENSLDSLEDLMWMGPVAFRFYVRAAIAYVHSEHATGDSDFIRYLAWIFSFRQESPAELVPCARLLADFCGTVAEQFERFDADPKIDFGLREKYVLLAELFTRVADETRTSQPNS